MNKIDGIIIKGIGGFYYVEAAGEIYECKARGVFRKSGIKPLAGDRVSISINDKAENTIEEIYERKSVFLRPPVANVDRLFIVSSVCEPKPVLLIIDRLTTLAVNKGIEPVVVFTKNDLENADEYVAIYEKAGIKTFSVSCTTGEGVDKVTDGNHNSKYLTGNRQTWIKFITNNPQIVKRYTLVSGNDAPERDPKDWNLEASTDGENWVILDERRNMAFGGRNAESRFDVDNDTMYQYYRLNILNNNGSNLFQLSEWTLYGLKLE